MLNRIFCAGLAILAAAGAARPAAAGSFEVTPIRVELAPGQSTTTINLRNLANEPSAVQVRAFNWTQANDQDDLAPTQDIVLSPPIFTIPPGQVQTVRLLLRARDAQPDHPWRLLFDEVPQPGKAGQIVMAMRLSVPVLIEPPGAPKPVLNWQAEREAGGQVVLRVSNPGRRPVRLTEVALHLPGGETVTMRPMAQNPYVLPGAERRWHAAPGTNARASAGANLRLTFATPAGPMDQTLALP